MVAVLKRLHLQATEEDPFSVTDAGSSDEEGRDPLLSRSTLARLQKKVLRPFQLRCRSRAK